MLDFDALFGLDGLVHALVVATSVQNTAGEFVDDEHFTVDDDVVFVALEKLLRLDGVLQVTDESGVRGLVKVFDAEPVFDALHTLLGDGDRALFLVDLVVFFAVFAPLQPASERREVGVPLQIQLDRATDDERRTRFVDEDRVDLVDDGEEMPALHEFFGAPSHVVAQVVETELVVGAVGDISGVRGPALIGGHLRHDDADVEAEKAVHPAHPLGVAAGQVIVHRDDVHALAREGVEIDRKRRDQRLSFTGLHFGDVAQVQRGATHDLDVEVPLAQGAPGGLAH